MARPSISAPARDRYYRLDLARECSTLKSINPHLLLRNREAV